MPERKDQAKNLFGENLSESGDGSYVDAEGNTRDKVGNLIQEVLSASFKEGLEIARKQHPDWSYEELRPLAQIHSRQIEAEKRRGKSKKI